VAACSGPTLFGSYSLSGLETADGVIVLPIPHRLMIYYLATAQHGYTIRSYLDSWGKALAGRIQVLPYEELSNRDRLPYGTYIFADLERLLPPQIDMAAEAWDQLTWHEDGLNAYNNPACVQRRHEMLCDFHARGWNRFRPYRAAEIHRISRFPVFFRDALQHGGNLTDLLASPEEVNKALRKLVSEGHCPRDLLAVEFCDTRDASGVYRKYSAFMVGEQIIPRTMSFSHRWMIKHPDLTSPAFVQEARQYVDSNPHEAELRRLFEAARVQYGRMDYGLCEGNVQVWEINTNPMVLLPPERYEPVLFPIHEQFAARIQRAFEAIDHPSVSSQMIPITFKPETLRALKKADRRRRLARLARSGVPEPLRACLRPLVRKARYLLTRNRL